MRTEPAGEDAPRHRTAADVAARAIAWLGGAAFVLSLAFFAWTYGVRFGRATPGAPADWGAALLVNGALFTAFALHHTVMARTAAKQWLVRRVPASLERSLYVWLSSALFAATCAWWRDIPVLLYDVSWPWQGALRALQAGGVWLTLRSAGAIDPLELAGIRQVIGRMRPPMFQVIGPYCLVRHPIYFGWVLMTFGTPLMTGTRLSFAILSTAYLIIAVPFEERSLVDTFGDEYREYQRRVRWRMVPGVF